MYKERGGKIAQKELQICQKEEVHQKIRRRKAWSPICDCWIFHSQSSTHKARYQLRTQKSRWNKSGREIVPKRRFSVVCFVVWFHILEMFSHAHSVMVLTKRFFQLSGIEARFLFTHLCMKFHESSTNGLYQRQLSLWLRRFHLNFSGLGRAIFSPNAGYPGVLRGELWLTCHGTIRIPSHVWCCYLW